MKKILLLGTLLSFVGVVQISVAQTEPEKINTKELFDTIERSELETEANDVEVEIENIIPVMEMPKLELNPNKVKKNQTRKRRSIKPTVKKPATKATVKTTVKKSAIKTTAKSTAAKQMVIAKRPIIRSQFRKHDKIVVFKDAIFVYRASKKHITQYSYKSQIPFDSKGLQASGSDFIIIDPIILNKDIRALSKVQKVQKVQKTDLNSTTENIIAPTKRHDIVRIKKSIEKKYNNSRKINSSILLKNLKVNDVIYLVNGLQFVKRKATNRYKNRKYWLTEMINKDAKSLKSIGNNKYRVIASMRK